MPEPFSIATGVFGLTTGSIGLLLTSVERLVHTSHSLRECKERLTQLQLHLEFSQRKLDDWVLEWSDNGLCYPESTYVFMWGVQGWSSLQTRIRCIAEENSHCQKILMPTTSSRAETLPQMSFSEMRDWERAVRTAIAGRPQTGETHLRIGKKIAFAVYQNSELTSRVDRIKKLVDDIDVYSKISAADVVRKHGEKSPFHRTDMVQKFFEKAKPLWFDLTDVYQALSIEPVALAMLFRPPNTNDLWGASEEQPLQIDLICTDSGFWAESECYWISAFYHFQRRRSVHLTADIQYLLSRMREDGEKTILQDTLKSVFKRAVSLSAEDRNRFNKNTELGRLHAAVAITTWVIYAWPTAWIDRICSCGIRYAVMVDTEKFPVFRGVTHHEDQECPGFQIPRSGIDKFILLGVLLAEIALACPIKVFQTPELEWEFGLCEYLGSNSDRGLRVDKIALLRLLNNLPLRPFRSAVAYCLGANPSQAAQSDICAEDVDAYMRHVVTP
jgi:hypothetical protein